MTVRMHTDHSVTKGGFRAEWRVLPTDIQPTTPVIVDRTVMMVSGGKNGSDLISVEAVSESGTPLCELPPLPHARWGHSMEGGVTCGGDGDSIMTTCVSLSTGGWVESHTLREQRYLHSSWLSPAGVVLIGGSYSTRTTELLSSTNTSTSRAFSLRYRTT